MCVAMQAFNFITALAPFSPTFDEDNQRDVQKRPKGPTQKPIFPNKPAEYLGTSNVGAPLAIATVDAICVLTNQVVLLSMPVMEAN